MVHHQKMWLTFLNVIVVDWSVASVTPRGLSVQDETLERAVSEAAHRTPPGKHTGGAEVNHKLW